MLTFTPKARIDECISRHGLQCLLKVCNNIVDVFDSNRHLHPIVSIHIKPSIHKQHTHPNQIRRRAGRFSLFLGQLCMRRRCGVDNERLGIAHVGEVACKSESIHRFARNDMVALDTKVQHASVRIRAEQFLGTFVVRVIFVAQIRDPCNLGVLFKPAKGVGVSVAETLNGCRKNDDIRR